MRGLVWEWVGTLTSGRVSSTLTLLVQSSKEGVVGMVVVELVVVELVMVMGVGMGEAMVEALTRGRRRRHRQLGLELGRQGEVVRLVGVVGSKVYGLELVVLG